MVTHDKEKHQYFKARQYVQKVLLNSLYGAWVYRHLDSMIQTTQKQLL